MRNYLVVVFCIGYFSLVSAKSDREISQSADFHPDVFDVDRDYVPELQNVRDAKSQGEPSLSKRKNIVHKTPFNEADLSMELFRETLSRHLGRDSKKSDACRYMRCSPGEECNVLDGRVKCVCKHHCKQRHNPICGTDDEFYENHCEMHRHACITGRDIYDARHKDCFYKVSKCNGGDMKQYLDMMMQFYKNVLTSAELRRDDKKDEQPEETKSQELSRSKRNTKKRKRDTHGRHHKGGLGILPDELESSRDQKENSPKLTQDEYDISTSTENPSPTVSNKDVTTPAQDKVNSAFNHSTEDTGRQDSLDLLRAMQSEVNLDTDEEEIVTKDSAGEMVKYIFALMDLDASGKIGSDEIWEITSLQHLDNVLPGPCTLFHVLKYGDDNTDRTLDITETLKLFNISVLRLKKNERYIKTSAICGSPAKMHCGIEGESEPLWNRYGREIKENNGARISGQFLYLNDVTSKNAGNYTCSSKAKELMTQTIDLQVMVSPRVKVHPRSQHPVLSSSATVKCHAEGRPRPIIRWESNGKPLDTRSGRYILMANNTELHFNAVDEGDSAAYSCIAENAAGIGEDVGAVYIQTNGVHENVDEPASAYFVFHQNGISVVNPHQCQTTRNIQADEKILGLLLQDKLCGMDDNDVRECVWAESVVVGSRFIYAAQPTEDRIIVVDKQLQRVVEVISTDVMPVQLYYVQSTDKVFVLCWIDEDRSRSLIQVINSAAVAGTHFAEHIRPVARSGHRVYDRSVHDFFIAPESSFHPSSQHGFVLHKDEMAIQVLNLAYLTYGNPIDLSPYGCVPFGLNYLPIGGLLHVFCLDSGTDNTAHEITIDVETGTEVDMKKNSGATQEYHSYDYSFVIKILPQHDMITLYNISDSGEMQEFMIIRTNFQVADVYFSRKKYKPEAMLAYMISRDQGNIMFVDLEKKKVEVIDGLTAPAIEETWPWKERTRKLTGSGWFGWFLASSGRTGMEIIGLNSNQILCRMDKFVHATAVAWSVGDI